MWVGSRTLEWNMLRQMSLVDDSLGGFSWSEPHGSSWVTTSNNKQEVKKSRLSGVAPVGWCFLKWTTWQWLDNNSGENKVSDDETAMIRLIMFQRSRKKKMETFIHQCYILTPLVLFPDCWLITILLSHSIICPIPNSEALRPGNSVTVSSRSDTRPVWSLVCYGLTID